jgi:hypothetical protein
MARNYKDHLGTVLSSSLQTLLTYSSGLITGGAVLQNVQLTNSGSSNRVVLVYWIPTGQTASAQYLIGKLTVPANDVVALPGGPWYGSSGAFVQASQDAGTDVTGRVTAFEETS